MVLGVTAEDSEMRCLLPEVPVGPDLTEQRRTAQCLSPPFCTPDSVQSLRHLKINPEKPTTRAENKQTPTGLCILLSAQLRAALFPQKGISLKPPFPRQALAAEVGNTLVFSLFLKFLTLDDNKH